jgi:serine protease AprX
MNLINRPSLSRQKAVWGPKRTVSAFLIAFGCIAPNAMAAGRHSTTPKAKHSRVAKKVKPGAPNSNAKSYKLDKELSFRSSHNAKLQTTRVVLRLQPNASLPTAYKLYARGRKLVGVLRSYTLDVPNGQLQSVCSNAVVLSCHYDRAVGKFNYRTSLTTGTRVVQQTLGLTGLGIGVAVIDSGIANWHDDLTNTSTQVYPFGNQRVKMFVDFVEGSTLPKDGDGHGTHVSGIIAGNGYDSGGLKAGVAPDASLISLRVLDDEGNGTISNIIAALDWVLTNHTAYNIRVVNMSVGAAILESAWTDPLTLAAKRVVDAGVVVVGAAGNFGKNSAGLPQYGGISAPGNAPWVLTVGGSSTNGTGSRADDTMGSYSSRGPTNFDYASKPDLVAPGTGTVSLAAPGSKFYLTRAAGLLPGSIATAHLPYLSLTGTSMAAPVVAGTVALMLQANPSLTPNAVKAILQYTAQEYPGYDALTQGAGFLNAVGAVRLARFYATAQPGAPMPVQGMWSKHLIWGNHLMKNGKLDINANAFRTGTAWGVAKTSDGDNVVWGTAGDGDNVVWGTAGDGDNVVWGTADDGDNIVWGTDCGGSDCDNVVWGTADDGDNIVWGTADDGDNIVWGTASDGDNIVWGTADGDNIVWGTADGDNIVWGTAADGDNIVWGTAADGDNIVWGTGADGDNIVWGTADGDNIVWGTAADGDNIVWGTDGDNIVWGTRFITRLPSTQMDWYSLFLNRRFDVWWVAHEFGDSFISKDGHHALKPTKVTRPRKPKSHRRA